MAKTLELPDTWRVVRADCIDVLRAIPDNSVDSIVTDPPYALEFMGKKWDGDQGFVETIKRARRGRPGPHYAQGNVFQMFTYEWGREALRVLKPGGYILAFAGSRTYHRLACGLEDAGFEVRDMLVWLHGQGFPKGANISKNLDKASTHFKADRKRTSGVGFERMGFGKHTLVQKSKRSALAEEHDEQHTALKPSLEPFVMGRKPPAYKNVTQNVYHYGVGALNIKECRVPVTTLDTAVGNISPNRRKANRIYKDNNGKSEFVNTGPSANGRWPANVLTDGSEVVRKALPATAGRKVAGTLKHSGRNTRHGFVGKALDADNAYTDTDSIARFFYTAKVHPRERQMGMPEGQTNEHPTVKPISLMRFCVRLITPPGGITVDPFTGSGSTGVAARLEGRRFLGIEREEPSAKTARTRIANYKAFAQLGLPKVKNKDAGTARDLAHVLREAARKSNAPKSEVSGVRKLTAGEAKAGRRTKR